MIFAGVHKLFGQQDQVFFSAASDVGTVREKNQDNMFLMRPVLSCEELEHYAVSGDHTLPVLFAVCDGMGGGKCGETASYIASERISGTDVELLATKTDSQLKEFFLDLYEDMNRAVFAEFGDRKITSGCTATLIYIDDRRVCLVNVGDSPGLCMDNSGLQVLTQSDNRANQLYRLGRITEQELWTHKTKNQLTQYIGMDEREVRISPHIRLFERSDKETIFLICSDGLFDRQGLTELEHFLREKIDWNDIRDSAQRCVKYAMDKGSRDNISAIVIKIGARNDT